MKVSIILPTKNEHGNIDILIKRINDVNVKHKIDSEILVVDDNSTDGTIDDVEKLMQTQKNLKIIQRKKYRQLFPRKWKYLGIGSAHKVGYNLAQGDLIISCDADLSHPPEQIPTLINIIQHGYDFVICSRYIEGGGSDKNYLNQIVSRVGSAYLSLMLGIKLRDLSNGYRAFKKEIWIKIKDLEYSNDNNFLIQSAYYAHKSGAKLAALPSFFKERVIGESKTPLLKELLRAIILPFRLKFLMNKRK